MILEHLNKTVNQITLYYHSIVSICFQGKDISVVEIKKNIREIKIIKTKKFNNSENIFDQINSDFNLKNKKIIINFYQPSGSFKLLEIPKMPQAEIQIWLIENTSDFLPTGLSIHNIFLSYKIVRSIDTLFLLLGIYNQTEIEELIQRIKFTEGFPAYISPGFLNCIRLDQLSESEINGK